MILATALSIHDPRDPSMQIIPTLGPKVCNYCTAGTRKCMTLEVKTYTE